MKRPVSLSVATLALLTAGGIERAYAQTATSTAPASSASEAHRFSISGSVRARYEFIEGQPRAGFNADDDLVSFRTRLLLGYDRGAVHFGAEFFDSRAYGADTRTPVSNNEVNTFEPVQAFVSIKAERPWGDGSGASVQAGRFKLDLGSRRLIADDDFRNTTNGFTGLRMDAAAHGTSVTLIYVLPQLRLPTDAPALRDNETELDRESDAYVLFGGVASIPLGLSGAYLQPSYYRLDENDQSDLATRNRRLDTFGLRYFRKPAPGAMDFDFETFVQTGSIRASVAPTAPTLDVDASFVHAEAGYRWNTAWKPRAAVQYDYVSGDKPGGSYNRFDTLFGMRRGELGPAGIYNALGRANLSAPGLRLEIEPGPRWDGFITWKALSLASKTDAFSTTGVVDLTGRAGADAGQQFDARLRYWLVPKRLRMETNFVYLAKGAFFDRAPNSTTAEDTTYGVFDMSLIY